jgi:molybdate transport system substrate-binding protein
MFNCKKIGRIWLFTLVTAFILASCGEARQPVVDLTVSAASSLTDALKELQKDFEVKNDNIRLNYNFGASGALQQQIEQGAPVDLFLSAATKNMQALLDKQLIETTRQTNLLTNELVVVIPKDSKAAITKAEDLAKDGVKHVAIGLPESVPAGSYAKEALISAKLWDTLRSKLVQGKDVRQVIQYVETGNADAGFVYKTDALVSKRVKAAFSVDQKLYSPVEYRIGVVRATKHSAQAEQFYNYLQTRAAIDIFTKYGFSALSKP